MRPLVIRSASCASTGRELSRTLSGGTQSSQEVMVHRMSESERSPPGSPPSKTRWSALLRQMVDIDSGSYNKPGIDAVGAVVRRFLEGHGITVETLPQSRHGDCLRATVGTAPGDRMAGRVRPTSPATPAATSC